ncbi:MAG: SufE family protein [Bdellovibrionales bacterium]
MNDKKNQLIKDFSNITSWEEKYKKLIEIGKALPPYPEKFRTDDFKISGCQSQVWLYAEKNSVSQLVHFYADSDALIVKGLIAILLIVYSEHSAKEILDLKPDFINEIGLMEHLTPSRANGLASMLKQIKFYALALS